MIIFRNKKLNEASDVKDLTTSFKLINSLAGKLRNKTYLDESRAKLIKRLETTLTIFEELPKLPSKAKNFGIKNLDAELPTLRNYVEDLIDDLASIKENIQKVIDIASREILYREKGESVDLQNVVLDVLTVDHIKDLDLQLNTLDSVCPTELYDRGAIINASFIRSLMKHVKTIDNTTKAIMPRLEALVDLVKPHVEEFKQNVTDAENTNKENKAQAEKEENQKKAEEKAAELLGKSQGSKKDWDTLFTSCKPEEVNAFWLDYWQTEWGDLGGTDLRDKLNPTFREDLIDHGFDANRNPLITFTKNFLCPQLATTLKSEHYALVSEAVDEHIISNEMLLGVDSLKETNLIRCKALYKLELLNALEYLKEQEEGFLNKYRYKDTKLRPEIKPIIDSEFGDDIQKLMSAVFYDNGETNPFKAGGKEVKIEALDLTLRPLNQVKALLEVLFIGEARKKELNLEDNDDAKQLLTKHKAEDLLATLYWNKVSSMSIKKIDSLLTELPKLKDMPLPPRTVFANILDDLDSLDIHDNNIAKFMKSIAIEGGLIKEEEKK